MSYDNKSPTDPSGRHDAGADAKQSGAGLSDAGPSEGECSDAGARLAAFRDGATAGAGNLDLTLATKLVSKAERRALDRANELAQQAEQLVVEAEVEVESVLADARQEAAQIVSQATGKAEPMLDEARGEADRLREEARADAARIRRDADEAAAEIKDRAQADAAEARATAHEEAEQVISAARRDSDSLRQRSERGERKLQELLAETTRVTEGLTNLRRQIGEAVEQFDDEDLRPTAAGSGGSVHVPRLAVAVDR